MRRVSVKLGRSKLVKWDDLRMRIISNCGQEVINKAAQALIDGHLVAFPTETVYGLGADAVNKKAIRRIYSVKGRPTDHPLIVHISGVDQIEKWAIDIPEYAIKLAQEFWPGPMTLILNRSKLAKDFVTCGQDNVGLRVPGHSLALALIIEFEKLGRFGIAAPSANRFGAVSPTTSEAVEVELGSFLQAEDLILDGGFSAVGIESSIIDCTKQYPVILRPGAITTEMIERTTGFEAHLDPDKSNIRTSGLFKSHYSPEAKVVLDASAQPGDGFIALAKIPTPAGAIRLASPNDIEGYARVLYWALREGDHKGLKKITIIQPDGAGLAEAIRDRLIKAAASK